MRSPGGDPANRHALLRRAVAQGWSPHRVRIEDQNRYPTRRRGVGGRPRKPVLGLDPEGALRKLGRLTDHWVRFHEGAFGDVGQAEWAKLGQATSAEQIDSLRSLVRAVETRLKELEGLARSARRTVREIGQALEPRT